MLRRHRLTARTQDSHSCNRGSIPLGAAILLRVSLSEFPQFTLRRIGRLTVNKIDSPKQMEDLGNVRRRTIPLGAAKYLHLKDLALTILIRSKDRNDLFAIKIEPDIDFSERYRMRVRLIKL